MAYTPVAQRIAQPTPKQRFADVVDPIARYTPKPVKVETPVPVKRGYVPVAERPQGPAKPVVPSVPPVKSTETKKRSGFDTFMDVSAGNLFSGVSKRAGAFVEASTKSLNPFNYVAAQMGRGFYKGIGKLTGLADDEAGKTIGDLGDLFYQDMRSKYKEVARASMDINQTFTRIGEEAKDTITSKTQQKRYFGKRSEAFTTKDLKDPQFWLYDAYGSLVENAPTMLLSIYTAGKAGLPASYGKSAQFLSTLGSGTMFSTTMNAAQESESAYSLALEEGASQEEAYKRGENVFRRNLKANTALEAAQMFMLFAPGAKVSSPFLNAFIKSLKLGSAGLVEAGQERMEDAIQAQAGIDTLDDQLFKASVFNPRISKTDVISAMMGMLVQGAGDVFIDNDRTKEEFEDQAEEVLSRINNDPNPPTGPSAVAALEEAIQAQPQAVEQAYREVMKERKTFADDAKHEAIDATVLDGKTEDVRMALESGMSKASIALGLANDVGTESAVAFVDQVQTLLEKEKTSQPQVSEQQATKLVPTDKTPREIDQEFSDTLTRHTQEIADVRKRITTAENDLRETQPQTNDRKLAKIALEKERTTLRSLEAQHREDLEDSTKSIRADIKRIAEELAPGTDTAPLVETVLRRAESPSTADMTLKQLVAEVVKEGTPAKTPRQAAQTARGEEKLTKTPKGTPEEIQAPEVSKGSIRAYYENTKVPAVGDVFVSKNGVRAEITAVSDRSVDYKLTGKKKGQGTIYTSVGFTTKNAPASKATPKKTARAKQAKNSPVTALEESLRAAYLASGPGSFEGFTKADDMLSQIAARLELSQAGERIFMDHDGRRDTNVIGVPSTFPQWIPESLRSSELFSKVLGSLEISKLHYPEGNRTRQRELYQVLLNELDAQLDIDTSAIRSAIMNAYDVKTQDDNEGKVAKISSVRPARREAAKPVKAEQKEVAPNPTSAKSEPTDEVKFKLRELHPEDAQTILTYATALENDKVSPTLQKDFDRIAGHYDIDVPGGKVAAVKALRHIVESNQDSTFVESLDLAQRATSDTVLAGIEKRLDAQRLNFIRDFKQRMNVDFDVHFADSILAGTTLNLMKNQKTRQQAYGLTADNSIVLERMSDDLMNLRTQKHEVVHLTLANMDTMPIFKRNGITRDRILRAQAEKLGMTGNLTHTQWGTVEEKLAENFELHRLGERKATGIIGRFFEILRTQLNKLARAIKLSEGDIVRDYYDLMIDGRQQKEIMTRFESRGIIPSFIQDGVLDAEKMDGALARFKMQEGEDPRAQKLKKTYNQLAEHHARLEADSEAWKIDLVNSIEVKKTTEEEIAQTPEDIKKYGRFVRRSVPPLGELTDTGKQAIETNFADPVKAEADIRAYLERKAQLVTSRNALRELRRKIADSKDSLKGNKQVLRDLERRLKQRKKILENADYYIELGEAKGKKDYMRLVRSRERIVDAYADQFGIGTENKKKIIGARSIYSMTDKEFNDFLTKFVDTAEGMSNKLSAQQQLRGLIQEKQFQKWENLRSAIKIKASRIELMTEQQATTLYNALSEYQFGDVFLSQRMLETIHRTNWGVIRTEREMYAKMKDVMGFGREAMATLTRPDGGRIWGIIKQGQGVPWIKLVRTHPFFKWLVERRVQATIQAAGEYHPLEQTINDLAKKARESRTKLMSAKERVAATIVPTDDLVFAYLEAEDKEAYAEASGMTQEELTFAQYIIAQYQIAYAYLSSEHDMPGRTNYMTHMQRSFLEAAKESGIKTAFTEMFTAQKENEAVFKILEEKTGQVVAFEKFFRYALHRSGEIVPSKNVARVTLEYFNALAKKRALDSFVPEAFVAFRAYEAYKGTTQRGLNKDETLETWVKKFLNDAKGRRISFGIDQGSNTDITLRAVMTWVSFKYLGFKSASAIANIFGDFAATSLVLSNKELMRGATRSFSLKRASEINEQYRFFTGRNPFTELADPRYNLPGRFWKAAMVLMGVASFQSQKFFLRAKMSESEWQTGVVEHERLVEIANALSRVKPNPFYVKSLAGNTTLFSASTQFMSWAFPVFNSTLSDAEQVRKMLSEKKSWDDIKTSEEWQLLSRTVVRMTMFAVLATLLTGDDDGKDKSYLGVLKTKIIQNINTGLEALLVPLDPRNYAMGIQEFIVLVQAMQQLANLEQYKRDGKDYEEGDLKFLNTLERLLTPSFVNSAEGVILDLFGYEFELGSGGRKTD